MSDSRINKDGVLIIKGQKFRKQEKNKSDAFERLREIIQTVLVLKKTRRPTRPSKKSQAKRLDSKAAQSKIKALRRNFSE